MLYYFNARLPQLLRVFVYVAVNPSVNITISKLPMCQAHKGPPLKIHLSDEMWPVPRCLGGWCQNFPGLDSFSKIESHDWKVLERWHILPDLGRARSKPSTRSVGMSFVGVSLRARTGPQRWARLSRLPSRSWPAISKDEPDPEWCDEAGWGQRARGWDIYCGSLADLCWAWAPSHLKDWSSQPTAQ